MKEDWDRFTLFAGIVERLDNLGMIGWD